MTDREKLVELLSGVQAGGMALDHEALKANAVQNEEVAEYLITNGVTVRQMQRPLTVEEAREMPDVVWVEWLFGGCEPRMPSTIDIDPIHIIEHYSFTDEMSERLDDYGKTWRCWAEKPTDEERKAAEWEK